MKYLVIILSLVIGTISVQAKGQNSRLEQIIFQSYDSIRNSIIRSACEIGDVKDSAILKAISEGRVDSVIACNRVDSVLANIIKQSDKKLLGNDYRKYDELTSNIRANFMGYLLICYGKKEQSIIQKFEVHRKGIDSLNDEVNSYLSAIKSDTAMTMFLKKYPKSKFRDLIPEEKRNGAGVKNNYLWTLPLSLVIFVLLIAILFFAYKLNKNRKNLAIALNEANKQSVETSTIDQGVSARNMPPTPVTELSNQELDRTENKADEKGMTLGSDDMNNVNAFAENHDNWVVVGASVIGNSHISMGLPCQDNIKYAYLKNGWGIAITSDGAGSAEHSDVGSRIVTERGVHYFKSAIEQKKWIEQGILPTEAEWTSIAFTVLKAIRDDIEKFATAKDVEFKSLSATIVVVIHTPQGFLTTHVGDGRAGYQDDTNEWKSLITPHKGEEANQTIFLTSDFWNLPYYVMSGVMVPESRVISCSPIAFTLMSDGCEHTSWLCNMKNEATGFFYDPNKPYDRFFNPLVQTVSKEDTATLDIRWARYIMSGNNSFKNEPDDKTMILGVFKK